jgi:enamine deaminase RidA (YjgF/YER057c/UK114 family)
VRKRFSSGSTFERDVGYSRAVVDGDYAFVSGTTGFDYATMTISESVTEQAEQACKNIEEALRAVDTSLGNVVRVRYIVPSRTDFEPCWPILRRYFGTALPAATMISAGLSDERMKIEIEVTARVDR